MFVIANPQSKVKKMAKKQKGINERVVVLEITIPGTFTAGCTCF